MIVAYYKDKAIGWSFADGKPLFQGDSEWIEHAKESSKNKEFISLYEGEVEGVAEVNNPKNLKGVFLALASLPRERIRVSKCPHGMMESLGINIEEFEDFPEDNSESSYFTIISIEDHFNEVNKDAKGKILKNESDRSEFFRDLLNSIQEHRMR